MPLIIYKIHVFHSLMTFIMYKYVSFRHFVISSYDIDYDVSSDYKYCSLALYDFDHVQIWFTHLLWLVMTLFMYKYGSIMSYDIYNDAFYFEPMFLIDINQYIHSTNSIVQIHIKKSIYSEHTYTSTLCDRLVLLLWS